MSEQPKLMTKRQVAAIIRKIERHMDAIGKHRDALRELEDRLSAMNESFDEGLSNLDCAIDCLSEFV
jgi:uncharacterized membrane protein